MDRFAGEEVELEGFAVAIAELGEAFAIRLGPLIAGAEQAARVFKESAVEGDGRAVAGGGAAAGGLEVMIDLDDGRGLGLGLLDALVGGVHGSEFRIGENADAKFSLAADDGTPD